MSRIDGLKKLIIKHERRLQLLKEKQAQDGADTWPQVIMEIEDIEQMIEELQTELAKLRSRTDEPPEPMWQILGLLVAIIGVAWVIYTFYANGKIFITPETTPKPSATITTAAAISIQPIPSYLESDTGLRVGQELRSLNGRFILKMQEDGNVVLYDNDNGMPLWATNTNGSNANYLEMQGDGNLVLYTVDGAIWSSQTASDQVTKNYTLLLQDDGNLVIYRDEIPIWATDTNQ